MISKELLSEVLGRECSYASLIENDVWYKTIVCVNGNNRPKEVHINIYELAHKCKEWAYSKGHTLSSGNNHLMFMSCSIRRTLTDDDWTEFYADTEREAIFKACEWIMEQTK